jgi:hypothetical protein
MSLAKRQAFTIIKKAYAALGRKPVTTPSTLRLIVPLTANRTSFSFPILEGDSNFQHPNQILLNRADAFTATQIGIFVGGLSFQGSSGWQPLSNISEYGNEAITNDVSILNKLPDFNENAFGLNSLLNVAVNNVQYLQNFDVLSVNKSAQMYAYGGSTQEYNDVTNGNYGEKDGFTDLVPTIQLSGTSKIDITLNSPIAISTASTPNNLTLEIIFRGFLSLGASNLNK